MSDILSHRPEVLYLRSLPNVQAVKRRFDDSLVRFDAWFLILMAVVLSLAATVFLGLTVWCVVHNHGSFTGSWQIKDWGLKVNAQCTR